MPRYLNLDHKGVEAAVVGSLLVFFFAIGLLSLRHKTPTADEAMHFRYGRRVLQGNTDRLHAADPIPDDSKMPMSALNALPWAIGSHLPDGWLKRISQTVQAGRPMTLLFSMVVAFFLYRWTRDLYGKWAGIFVLFMYCLEPSIIAHSQLVTTDIYGMGMIMLATYALWRFNRRRSAGNLILLGMLLGLSQAAKYSAVFLVPIFIVIQLVHDSPEIFAWMRGRDLRSLYRHLRGRALEATVVLALSLLVINVAYVFDGTLTPLGKYAFRSDFFQAIQARLGVIQGLPIPLPFPYLQGLDLVKYVDQVGYGIGRIFLLGRLSSHGFPGYYFYDIGLKTPLAILVAIVAGIVVLVRRRSTWKQLLQNESFLVVPAVWFLFYMNYMLHAQLGIRLILVIFPFLLILAGNLTRDINRHDKWRLGLTFGLGIWLVASVFSYYPNFLAYFNEIVWDRSTTYRYLTDSDLNWGQSVGYLDDFLAKNPGYTVNPTKPTTGFIIVDPNKLDGIFKTQQPNQFAWLRDNFDPVDIIANTYPVFHITKDDLTRLGYTPSP